MPFALRRALRDLSIVIGILPCTVAAQTAQVTRPAASPVTVRALRITEPIRMDGRLDEAVYAQTPPISDFIQQEPVDGAMPTERTDAWVFFDAKNIYV